MPFDRAPSLSPLNSCPNHTPPTSPKPTTSKKPRTTKSSSSRGKPSEELLDGASPLDNTALHDAIVNNDIHRASQILDRGAFPSPYKKLNQSWIGLLSFAVALGNLKIAKLFLERPIPREVDVRTHYSLILHLAVTMNLTEPVIKTLQLLGNEPLGLGKASALGSALLEMAIGNQNEAIAKILIEAGSEVKDVGRSDIPLHQAAKDGNVDIVKLLLTKGANCLCAGKSAMNAVEAPVESRNPDLVKLLETTVGAARERGRGGYN
jgi:ankyrin repeat protein